MRQILRRRRRETVKAAVAAKRTSERATRLVSWVIVRVRPWRELLSLSRAAFADGGRAPLQALSPLRRPSRRFETREIRRHVGTCAPCVGRGKPGCRGGGHYFRRRLLGDDDDHACASAVRSVTRSLGCGKLAKLASEPARVSERRFSAWWRRWRGGKSEFRQAPRGPHELSLGDVVTEFVGRCSERVSFLVAVGRASECGEVRNCRMSSGVDTVVVIFRTSLN